MHLSNKEEETFVKAPKAPTRRREAEKRYTLYILSIYSFVESLFGVLIRFAHSTYAWDGSVGGGGVGKWVGKKWMEGQPCQVWGLN